jgi:hypothetical protein
LDWDQHPTLILQIITPLEYTSQNKLRVCLGIVSPLLTEGCCGLGFRWMVQKGFNICKHQMEQFVLLL